MSVKVKICGLKRPEDIRAVNEAEADFAGFVFFERSKRNVSFETAKDLLHLLNPNIQSVAVCVSPTAKFICEVSKLGFNRIQIHGGISPEILSQIQTPVWQAVNIKNGMNPTLFLKHEKIDGYVIDGADYGGGKTFGWEDDNMDFSTAASVRDMLDGKTFILAGGLNVHNAAKGIELFHPDVVDVSSGVELDGLKDNKLIRRFIRKVREQ